MEQCRAERKQHATAAFEFNEEMRKSYEQQRANVIKLEEAASSERDLRGIMLAWNDKETMDMARQAQVRVEEEKRVIRESKIRVEDEDRRKRKSKEESEYEMRKLNDAKDEELRKVRAECDRREKNLREERDAYFKEFKSAVAEKDEAKRVNLALIEAHTSFLTEQSNLLQTIQATANIAVENTRSSAVIAINSVIMEWGKSVELNKADLNTLCETLGTKYKVFEAAAEELSSTVAYAKGVREKLEGEESNDAKLDDALMEFDEEGESDVKEDAEGEGSAESGSQA